MHGLCLERKIEPKVIRYLTNKMSEENVMRCAAIVCLEVANGAPILYAERSSPEDKADSGWQFLCGASSEDWQSAKVWAVHEVLNRDPSLTALIDLPYGTILSRHSANEKWNVTKR
jgi:hypothetical protein